MLRFVFGTIFLAVILAAVSVIPQLTQGVGMPHGFSLPSWLTWPTALGILVIGGVLLKGAFESWFDKTPGVAAKRVFYSVVALSFALFVLYFGMKLVLTSYITDQLIYKAQGIAQTEASRILADTYTLNVAKLIKTTIGVILAILLVWAAAAYFTTSKIVRVPILIVATFFLVTIGTQMVWDVVPAEYQQGIKDGKDAVLSTVGNLPAMVLPVGNANVNLNQHPVGEYQLGGLKYNQTLMINPIQQNCTWFTVQKSWLRDHGLPANVADEQLFSFTDNGVIQVTVNEPYQTLMKEGSYEMGMAVISLPGKDCPADYPRPN